MTSPSDPTMTRRAAGASFLGSALEWYDFSLYGVAAAAVFNKLFFTNLSPAMGTLVAFATLAVGFLVRPLGGLIFGHIADRHGRRKSMIITLFVMGAGTTLIGLLPTYDQVGYLAPILLLLLRVIQGLGVGGEFGSAAVLAVEHAPARRRGFYGSFCYSGTFLGIVMSTGVFAAVSTLPDEALMNWGWRIPFLLSVVIVAASFIVRRKVSEAPGFVALVHGSDKRERIPALGLFRRYWKETIAIALIVGGPNTIFLLVVNFSVAYAHHTYGIPTASMLIIVTLVSAILVLLTPLGGMLSDRVGRRIPIATGIVIMSTFLFVYFWALGTGKAGLIFVAMLVVAGAGQALCNGVLPAFFCEAFPPEVRGSGVSIGQQIGGTIGGFAPLVASSVVVRGGSWPIIASYGLVLCILGLLALVTTNHRARWGVASDAKLTEIQAHGSEREGTLDPSGTTI